MRLFFYLQKYYSLGFPKAEETPSAWRTSSRPVGFPKAEQVAGLALRRPRRPVGFLQAEQVPGPHTDRCRAWQSAFTTPKGTSALTPRSPHACYRSSSTLSSSSRRLSFLTLLPPFLLNC